jgi:hypothetical protein
MSGVNTFQFSVKVGGNILVVGGETADQFEKNFKELFGDNGWATAISDFENRVLRIDENKDPVPFDNAVQNVQAGLTGAHPGLSTGAPAPAYPAAAPQPTTAAPLCAHGAREFKAAKPGSGKNWTAWFCPTPKGTPDQCPAIFN